MRNGKKPLAPAPLPAHGKGRSRGGAGLADAGSALGFADADLNRNSDLAEFSERFEAALHGVERVLARLVFEHVPLRLPFGLAK